MEISNKIPPLSPTTAPQKVEKAAEKTVGPAGTTERVALSENAKTLQAALRAVQQMDDVDQEKVARIKAQLKAGTYKVDAEKIAGKLIEESLLSELD